MGYYTRTERRGDMRILHISDPGIDMPVFVKKQTVAQKLRNEVRKALASVSLFLRTDNVDLLLISGGLFDNRYLTPKTAQLLLRDISLASPCKVVVSPGKTDFFSGAGFYSSYPLPDNLFIFKSNKLSCFEIPELRTRVYGYAFDSPTRTESAFPSEMPELDPEYINLFCGYAKIGVSVSELSPLTLTQIRKSGFDYAAVGGVGEGGVERAGKTYYGTPGCLCGHGFSDVGYRSGLLIDIEKSDGVAELRSKGIRFFRKRFEDDEIDVSGAADREEIRKAIVEHVIEKKYNRDTILRITLTGNVREDVFPEPERYERDLDGILFHIEVKDRTVPAETSFRMIRSALRSENEATRISAALANKLICKAKTREPKEKKTVSKGSRAK